MRSLKGEYQVSHTLSWLLTCIWFLLVASAAALFTGPPDTGLGASVGEWFSSI